MWYTLYLFNIDFEEKKSFPRPLGSSLVTVFLVSTLMPVLTVITSKRLRETVWTAAEAAAAAVGAAAAAAVAAARHRDNMVHPVV